MDPLSWDIFPIYIISSYILSTVHNIIILFHLHDLCLYMNSINSPDHYINYVSLNLSIVLSSANILSRYIIPAHSTKNIQMMFILIISICISRTLSLNRKIIYVDNIFHELESISVTHY